MWKGKYFDRKNYKALKNKVNHCGRMPGVDKWKRGNVSTTSAICFLCCQFFLYFILIVLFLSALFPCFLCHISLLAPFLSFHYISACTVSFSLFVSVSFSLFLSKILFVRCQRSRKARYELREVS